MMSIKVSFVLYFVPRDILDEILDLIESRKKKYWGGGGLQQFYGRPTIALSSALVPHILSCI